MLQHIISGFIDSSKSEELGQYSIQCISILAQKEMNIKPGSWFNPCNISHCLAQLHKERPLPGTKNMIIKVAQDMNVIEIVKDMEAAKDSPLLFIALAMLGFQSSEKSRLEVLKKLMKMKYFNGMLGGIPNKAFYFIGVT